MGRNKELFFNTLYFFVGSLGTKFIGFLMMPFYTAWLSPGEYGTIDLVQTYVQILFLIVGLDIADALVVFPINKQKDDINRQFTSSLIFHCFSCLFFFFAFLCLDYCRFEFLSSINDVLWYAFGILITTTTLNFLQSFCRGLKKMKVFSYNGIIQSLTIALFSFLLVPTMGFTGNLWALILANIVSSVILIKYSNCFEYFAVKEYSKEVLKEMLYYSIPLVPNSLMWWIILGLNRPLLEQYHGVYAIGILAVANKIPTLISSFYGLFHRSWIATATTAYGCEDFESFYNKVYGTMMYIQCICCFIVLLFGKLFIDHFIDVEYSEAWIYMPFITVTSIVSNIATYVTTIFTVTKKTKYIFYTVIIAAIVSVVLNFLLIPKFGLWGALVAMFIAHSVTAVTRIIYGWKMVHLRCIKMSFINISMSFIASYVILLNNSIAKYLLFVIVFLLFLLYNKQFAIESFNISINQYKVLKNKLYGKK